MKGWTDTSSFIPVFNLTIIRLECFKVEKLYKKMSVNVEYYLVVF